MIVLAVIIYATWVPKPIDDSVLPSIPNIDKLIHAIMFGGLLGALLFDYHRTYPRKHPLTVRVILWSALGVALFGVVDEIVQGQLDIGRPSDFYDLLADWAGIIVASFTAPPLIRSIYRTKQ